MLREKSTAYCIDAHLHLQDKRLATDCEGVIQRAGKRGVQRFFCNATCEQDWEKVYTLAEHFPCIVPFWGVHPWFADTPTPGWELRLQQLLQAHPGGIGETGLDKACSVDFDQQVSVFMAQLNLAVAMQRPLVIHCIRAWGKLVDSIEVLQGRLPPIMVHSFSGSREMMERCVGLGLYLSFSTRLLNPYQEKLRRVFAATPLEHILLETDAPDQLSLFHKEQGASCNEPQWVADLYERAAEMKQCDPQDLQTQLASNATVFTHATALG
ncbi:MAG: hypothetical protein CSB34_03475 [Desulfobulbus propionicus]|nr:MAG: hypothetical protein CSB34_03475 [Desulfobulbus propionicus]